MEIISWPGWGVTIITSLHYYAQQSAATGFAMFMSEIECCQVTYLMMEYTALKYSLTGLQDMQNYTLFISTVFLAFMQNFSIVQARATHLTL
jgi:hypothetical protein